jgi:hypothetical protein
MIDAPSMTFEALYRGESLSPLTAHVINFSSPAKPLAEGLHADVRYLLDRHRGA